MSHGPPSIFAYLVKKKLKTQKTVGFMSEYKLNIIKFPWWKPTELVSRFLLLDVILVGATSSLSSIVFVPTFLLSLTFVKYRKFHMLWWPASYFSSWMIKNYKECQDGSLVRCLQNCPICQLLYILLKHEDGLKYELRIRTCEYNMKVLSWQYSIL